MSFLGRLLGRGEAERRDSLPPPTIAALSALAAANGGSGPVPTHLVENLAAVAGGVELIAAAISSLPATLTMDTPDGLAPAPGSASAWRLIARPNPQQSWAAYAAMSVAQLLMTGNSLSMLTVDGRGAVTRLTPVPWAWVTPKLVSSGGGASRLVYDVADVGAERTLLEVPDRLLTVDVMHVRGRSDSGVLGRSLLARGAAVVREALQVQTAAAAIWANGLALAGFVETGGAVLTEAQRERFKASLAEFRGSGNAGKTMLLEGPFKYSALGVSPGDAELLGSRRFSVSEVARLLVLPEAMLQTGQHGPAYPELLAMFAQQTLAPLVSLFEQEFDAQVLPPGYHLSIDLGGLQRGNYSAVAAAQAVLVQSGIATSNDGRRAVGLPAHADGDMLRPGNAPTWPADGTGLPSLAPKPGQTGAEGLPNLGTNQGDGGGSL